MTWRRLKMFHAVFATSMIMAACLKYTESDERHEMLRFACGFGAKQLGLSIMKRNQPIER
jgi:hypothetical protein